MRQHLGPTEWNPRHVTPSSYTFRSSRDTSPGIQTDKAAGRVGNGVPTLKHPPPATLPRLIPPAAQDAGPPPFGKCL